MRVCKKDMRDWGACTSGGRYQCTYLLSALFDGPVRALVRAEVNLARPSNLLL
jgi:hypothetical protein